MAPVVTTERIAVIGAGVSGLAAGQVWKRCGYNVTVFDARDRVGGQWCESYEGVALQNTTPQYQFAEFPWPFETPRHPTGSDVLKYAEAFIKHFQLDVKLNRSITQMKRELNNKGGWTLEFGDGSKEWFSYVIIATGEFFTGDKKILPFLDADMFQGKIFHTINDFRVLNGKKVVVIGFGKTALDFATLAAVNAKETVHIFRKTRWTFPDYILGICFTVPMFARISSIMMTSWHHPSALERFLHGPLRILVGIFWYCLSSLFHFQTIRDAKLGNKVNKKILDPVIPPKSQFQGDLRAASALAPPRYYEYVAHSAIQPISAEIDRFYDQGVVLANGKRIKADVVCVCCGSKEPSYPFLPEEYRRVLERVGGPLLFRNSFEPNIPDLGFCQSGSFLHLAVAHMAALWQVAARRGDIIMPTKDEMLLEAKCTEDWKNSHLAFEPTQNMVIGTRFQQMLDMYCQDLGLSPYRKLPNIFAELFMRYDPTDYAGCVNEYLQVSPSWKAPRSLKPMSCIEEAALAADK